MRLPLPRRVLSGSVRRILPAVLLLHAGWSGRAADEGITGVSNPGRVVCARDDAGRTWCTRADAEGRFRITRAESKPGTGRGALPGAGAFRVYTVDCPAAGQTVDRGGKRRDGGAWLDVRCVPDGCVAAPAGLIAWFPFDAREGGTADDFAGGSPLRLRGAEHGTGRVLGGLALEGRNAYAAGAEDRNLGTGDFSIAFWLRLDEPNAIRSRFRSLLDKREWQPIRGYHVAMHGDDPLLQVADGAGYHNYHSGISAPLSDGKWHHLAVTVQRASAAGVRWYVDGRPAGRVGDARYHPRSLRNAVPLFVGGHSASGPSEIDGAMDELMILDRVLSPAEIATIQSRHVCR
jgi:hypothetical protein